MSPLLDTVFKLFDYTLVPLQQYVVAGLEVVAENTEDAVLALFLLLLFTVIMTVALLLSPVLIPLAVLGRYASND